MPAQTPRKSVRSRKEPPRTMPPESSAAFPTHALIAGRAYELFLQRGGEHGRDWEDWLTAERELSPSSSGFMIGDFVHQ
jgi:Protein of unknown function (DUF2934)